MQVEWACFFAKAIINRALLTAVDPKPAFTILLQCVLPNNLDLLQQPSLAPQLLMGTAVTSIASLRDSLLRQAASRDVFVKVS